MSTEEMGRKIRYEAFRQILGERKGRIAVAHNSNDRAETMLFHLFRGSGIRGLASILPVRGRIIRPILCLERWEIEDFLTQQGIFYCKDALINIIGHNRTSGDLGIPDFTSEFQFSNGAFSVADSGFTVDMAALDRRLTPQPHDNMYSDMYEYSFRKVL